MWHKNILYFDTYKFKLIPLGLYIQLSLIKSMTDNIWNKFVNKYSFFFFSFPSIHY